MVSGMCTQRGCKVTLRSTFLHTRLPLPRALAVVIAAVSAAKLVLCHLHVIQCFVLSCVPACLAMLSLCRNAAGVCAADWRLSDFHTHIAGRKTFCCTTPCVCGLNNIRTATAQQHAAYRRLCTHGGDVCTSMRMRTHQAHAAVDSLPAAQRHRDGRLRHLRNHV